jgi:acetyl/propionyl-CoA carboxylase alpha subunit
MADLSIRKVFIANRGEIAARIERACKKLGLASCTAASEVDKGALFARSAAEIAILPGAAATDTYLNQELLIKKAKEHGCDALHPGYGFLSENAEFAAAVIKAGLVWIGPQPHVIHTLGSKTEARKAVTAKGVPVVEGCEGALSDQEIIKAAEKIGFPVIVKAVGGGGGRGMRIIREKKELVDQLPLARAEALKNFKNQDVYFERFVENPRHIEVQIFGDNHGNVVHFGTRECSVQRRHQKLIEEAPAPRLPEAVREGIHAAAIKAAKSVGYSNAGTVEFILSGDKFFFLEVNTRIQVEHPVTEEITGVDLVALQIQVACGAKLQWKQSDIKFSKHAIEFRICAEDVKGGFLPVIGDIGEILHPTLPSFVRYESGFGAGDIISRFYDSMIAKVIVVGEDREQAISRAKEFLAQYKIKRLLTTIEFHRWVLDDQRFSDSTWHIKLVDSEFKAKNIDDFLAKSIRDPNYKAPVSDAFYVENFRYYVKNFDYEHQLELIHHRDGLVIAVPVQKGVRACESFMRSSNSRVQAMKALIEEVLEKTSPQDIFELHP